MSTVQEPRRVVTDADAHSISRVEELSYELKIADVMTRNVHTVAPDMQIVEVLDLFRRCRVSGAPVMVDGKMIRHSTSLPGVDTDLE